MALIWRLLPRFQKNPSRNLWENGIFVFLYRFLTQRFRHFRSKGGNCLKASRMYGFEANRNPRTPKGVTFNALQNVCPRFLIFLFWSQIQNFGFSKINAFKIQNFGAIKTNIYSKATHKQHTYQISKQYLYFWLGNSRKENRKGDNVTFTCNFWEFLIVCEN